MFNSCLMPFIQNMFENVASALVTLLITQTWTRHKKCFHQSDLKCSMYFHQTQDLKVCPLGIHNASGLRWHHVCSYFSFVSMCGVSSSSFRWRNKFLKLSQGTSMGSPMSLVLPDILWTSSSRLPLPQLITYPVPGSAMSMTLLSCGNMAKTSSCYFWNTSMGHIAASNSPRIRIRMATSCSWMLRYPDNWMAHSLTLCTGNPPTLTTTSTAGPSFTQASRFQSSEH